MWEKLTKMMTLAKGWAICKTSINQCIINLLKTPILPHYYLIWICTFFQIAEVLAKTDDLFSFLSVFFTNQIWVNNRKKKSQSKTTVGLSKNELWILYTVQHWSSSSGTFNILIVKFASFISRVLLNSSKVKYQVDLIN